MEDKIKSEITSFVGKHFPDVKVYRATYKNQTFCAAEYDRVYQWLKERYDNSEFDEANAKLKEKAIRAFYDDKGFE